MAVDRNLWAERYVNNLPHWRCPTCNKGYFAVVGELQLMETGPSAAAHAHEAWDPDWIENRVIGLLECSMPACKEVATIAGSSKIDHFQVDYDEYVTDNVYYVGWISPAPVPISYPDKTPDTIVERIKIASAYIWTSPDATANHIRQAVECLMDDAKISDKTKTGKPIMLHQRIKEFQKTDKENGDVLLAVKWLGNSGSHIGDLTREDVFDAFDMIEFVLENRYGTVKADLLAKVAAVNAAKGPAAKKPAVGP